MPEHRDIFPGLTVRQNLMLGVKDPKRSAASGGSTTCSTCSPNLKARADTAAGVLSGGEKQMLTICRTLMGDPELVMIDEPTEGLAPIIVQQVGDLIAEIARRGVAILLVEQKLSIAMRISHRVYVMGHGQIVFEGTPGRPQGQRGGAQGVARVDRARCLLPVVAQPFQIEDGDAAVFEPEQAFLLQPLQQIWLAFCREMPDSAPISSCVISRWSVRSGYRMGLKREAIERARQRGRVQRAAVFEPAR